MKEIQKIKKYTNSEIQKEYRVGLIEMSPGCMQIVSQYKNSKM